MKDSTAVATMSVSSRNQALPRYRLAIFVIILVGGLLLVAVKHSSPFRATASSSSAPTVRARRQLLQQQVRPIISTYYTRIPTDTTSEDDDRLLEIWNKTWYEAGWDPRVLTVEDAKKHPDFEELMKLTLDQDLVGPYNMHIYYRWIAMAASGGGFLCDYDVFPLNPFLRHGRTLPFDGMLTVYDKYTPSLVSGSEHEYLRMVKRIGESLHRHVHFTRWQNKHSNDKMHLAVALWSDMHSLKLLREKSPDIFKSRQDVLHGEAALRITDWTVEQCEMARGKMAVHFSYRSLKEAETQYEEGHFKRHDVLGNWLSRYNQTCDPTPVPNVL